MTGDAVVYERFTRTQSCICRCPAMSITEQGPALPATLLPALQKLLLLGSSLGHRGGLRCLSTPHPGIPGPSPSISHFHPGSPEIFIRAARKYNFNLVRASRSQVPPEPGNSRVSPESALQILALPSGQTQNLLTKHGARTG